jgi:hypothetical protein
MFLSPEEIEVLTGYRRWSAQRRWLSEHGYRHDVAGSGRPVLLRAEVERHLVGSARPAARRDPRLDLLT